MQLDAVTSSLLGEVLVAVRRVSRAQRRKIEKKAVQNKKKGKKTFIEVSKVEKGRRQGTWKATAIFTRRSGAKTKAGKPRKFTQMINMKGKHKPSLRVAGGKLMVKRRDKDGTMLSYEWGKRPKDKPSDRTPAREEKKVETTSQKDEVKEASKAQQVETQEKAKAPEEEKPAAPVKWDGAPHEAVKTATALQEESHDAKALLEKKVPEIDVRLMNSVETAAYKERNKQHWKTWENELDPEDEQAVAAYTGRWFKPANMKLREGHIDDPDTNERKNKTMQVISGVQRALEKASLPEPVMVMRATVAPGLWQDFDAGKISEGAVYRTDQFFSTTIRGDLDVEPFQKAEKAGKVTWHIALPKGAHAAFVDSISLMENEDEMLLANGSELQIRKAEKDENGILHITADYRKP